MEVLQIENLSFRYPNTEANALTDISLQIHSGDFVVVCGKSGCGKTTLLRLLKKELAPAGEMRGTIRYKGTSQEELDPAVSAAEIGFVMQNPESQIVTDRVWHELAFGAENLGIPTEIIRRRVGEMAGYFGIEHWFRQKTDTLSGGQKQLLNLAAVMVMQPELLILDEPTAQLDPIAAADFIATLQKLNRELGLTVILVEHRLEEVFPIADKVLMLEDGQVLLYDTPKAVGQKLPALSAGHPMLAGLPAAVRVYSALEIRDECPLTVKEGRDFLERHFAGQTQPQEPPIFSGNGKIALELKDVWFRYEKDTPDVLRGMSLKVREGEVFAVLGGNGTGKTTALNVMAGLDRAYRGKVLIGGKPIGSYKGGALYRQNLACLPQNPQNVFLKTTVQEDLLEAVATCPAHEQELKLCTVAQRMGITHLMKKHPYDLSGGEMQKCALAKLLLTEPRILLLDEPTKGLDAGAKEHLQTLLADLAREGLTVLLVTHDIEFAAEAAHRCALFFDGEVLSVDVPRKFFSENNFYTTAANRMARRLWPTAVTCHQVVDCCLKEVSP